MRPEKYDRSCTSPRHLVFRHQIRHRMTLTLTEMLIQREKNVKASFSLKDWPNE
jgi:hypothetical protein